MFKILTATLLVLFTFSLGLFSYRLYQNQSEKLQSLAKVTQTDNAEISDNSTIENTVNITASKAKEAQQMDLLKANQYQTRQINPKLTDPEIETQSTNSDNHFSYVPESKNKGQLVIFFSGTGGSPQNQQLFMETAAINGFHGLNLSYQNSVTVIQACKGADSLDCFEKSRREVIYGESYDNKINVNKSNSVQNRLVKALDYLNKTYPNEGWEKFIDSELNINWSNIILAGHSQGSGIAAYMATQNKVSKVLMFGGPNDEFRNQIAPWLVNINTYSKTPIEKFYGFNHSSETGYKSQIAAWDLMGLPGQVKNVDTADYSTTNRLTTKTKINQSGKNDCYHGSTVVDRCTPKSVDQPNTPLFEPVWIYMLNS